MMSSLLNRNRSGWKWALALPALALGACASHLPAPAASAVPPVSPALSAETEAERILRDVSWLADPAREGRGIGTAGLRAAGEYLEKRFQELGLAPAGEGGGYRQGFQVITSLQAAPETALMLGGVAVPAEALSVLGFSSEDELKAPLVFAGYGIRDTSLGVDDYAGVDVRGKVVLVRRFVPEREPFLDTAVQRRHGDLRHKAWTARQQGARALLVVDWPESPSTEARLPTAQPEGTGDAGLPVLAVKRSAVEALLPKLLAGEKVEAALKVRLEVRRGDAFNVVGRIPAGVPAGQRLPGVVVIGAHYDHLGLGGAHSLAPDRHEPHLGADDNASGTASLLELAHALRARREHLRRDVVVVAFSGEEAGVIGSTVFTRAPPAGLRVADMSAMLNLDMVGRMQANRLSVLGAESASEWPSLVQPLCEQLRLECALSGDGYGPSDQTPFYAAGVPVLHFFTGAHPDYHKPSDTPDRLDAAGMARVARVAALVAETVAGREAPLTYKKVPAPLPRGDLRSFNASLGTIPDYTGAPDGRKGVLLAGVRAGGAAESAGLRRGDLLVRLGRFEIGGVEDLMYALNASKPGESVSAVVLRDGQELRVEVIFQESRGRK
ncbi:tolB protein precursor protein [Archangium gephyra]|uniref:TolB protein protein n=1 Tax=Archangium gephyra TaxID=48 RepID=A0AAC8QH36_9BACT|nr:tolB protein precursor protein [Archangium gephyra]